MLSNSENIILLNMGLCLEKHDKEAKDEGEEVRVNNVLDLEDLKSSAITAKQLEIEGEDIESSLYDRPPEFPPSK